MIAKRDPLERVGNVVRIDGRLMVIEYSDLPEDAANRRNADGSLSIWAGSIAVHVIAAALLRRTAGGADIPVCLEESGKGGRQECLPHSEEGRQNVCPTAIPVCHSISPAEKWPASTHQAIASSPCSRTRSSSSGSFST